MGKILLQILFHVLATNSAVTGSSSVPRAFTAGVRYQRKSAIGGAYQTAAVCYKISRGKYTGKR